MKKVLLLMLCSASLFSMPAKRTPTVVSQPDGTTFSVVGFGDERYNYAETLDGYVVIRGSDEYWYYATLSPEGRFIPSAYKVQGGSKLPPNQTMMSIPKHLTESQQVIAEKQQAFRTEKYVDDNTLHKSIQGLMQPQSAVMHVLILCVQYSDLVATQTSASFQDMVNNDSWKDGIGGMSKYYKDVSYEAVSIQADYKDWITAAQPSSYYAYSNANYSTHVRELVSQCVDAAEANGVDFSLYDNDGDGAVDGLFIVHSGRGAEEGSQTQYIWSHTGGLSTPYSRTYDGKTINMYIIMPELYGSNHVDIGVFCHEYGHMLGLPDLYDTDGASHGSSQGVGNWCLMAGGSWGGNGYTPERPSHMSAYCKELLGYTNPTVVASSQALSIPRAETNSFSYKIWMDNNKSDEYMLIENRQQTGFDLNLPTSGLLIYHVDKNLADIWPASNGVNVTNTHLGVKVYEADGLEQMAGNTNRGDAGDPYPGSTGNTSLTQTSTPNSRLWNTNASGVEITSISASGATMTAAAVLPTYYGYPLQFYRTFNGWFIGSSISPTGYAMVRCTPAFTGKLEGLRVFSYGGWYTNITATAYANFTSKTLSGQLGSPVGGASPGITSFVELNFSPAIDVTQNVPIYVKMVFQRASDGYTVPVDITLPATGNSYSSTNGTTFDNLVDLDIAVRAVFRRTPVSCNARVLLQGPFAAGMMSTALRTAGSIPLTQPYNIAPWNYAGTESVSSIPADVVDWVLVQLRTGTAASSTTATRAAFVKRDGFIVDLDGLSPVGFPGVAEGLYYIVLRHRNHLAVMSANHFGLTPVNGLADFRAAGMAYGLASMVEVTPGIYAMYAGDVTPEGAIVLSDELTVIRTNNLQAGYNKADVNMDDAVVLSDELTIVRANNLRGTNVP